MRVACFKDGVYTGGNSLYERFTAPTTFRAENTYRAVLQNNSRALSLFGARHLVFEGFEFRHTGPGAEALVVQVQMDDAVQLGRGHRVPQQRLPRLLRTTTS